MTPETNVLRDPDPCSALGCAVQTEPVEVCRDHRCPHRWTREARLDREAREEKDRNEMMQRAEG